MTNEVEKSIPPNRTLSACISIAFTHTPPQKNRRQTGAQTAAWHAEQTKRLACAKRACKMKTESHDRSMHDGQLHLHMQLLCPQQADIVMI